MSTNATDGLISTFKISIRNTAPLLPGTLFFGLLYGFTGASLNFPLYFISGMSLLVNSGSIQFITIVLMSQEEPLVGIVITAIIINLRLLFYGAALKNMFELKFWQKLIWSHFILDESFIVTSVVDNQLESNSNMQVDTKYIFLFSGIVLSTTWNITTIFGFVLFSSLEDLISFPSNFIIAASFVGFLGIHWIKYPKDRILIIVIGILSVFLGFVFSSSDLIIILMITGIIFNMFRFHLNRDK